MSELDGLKCTVENSSELSKKGQHREALTLLDNAVVDAMKRGRGRWVYVLNQHAAVICDSIGDLELVRHYCEEAVKSAPESAMAQYALADVLFRQGRVELAKQHAARSCSLIADSNAPEGKGLLNLITKRWPELGKP